jgi:hypothetical protein
MVMPSSSMVQGLVPLVQLGLEGAGTNLFGWGCPLYCFQPSFATFSLVLILGFALGASSALLATWTLWTRFGHLLLSVPNPSSGFCP